VAEYRKEMGPPPVVPVKKMAGGGSVTRGDGCVTKGHTKGRVM